MSDLKSRLKAVEDAEIEAVLREDEAAIRQLAQLSGRGYATERRLMGELLRRLTACPDDADGRIVLGPWAAWCAATYGGTPEHWSNGYLKALAEEVARESA